PSTTISYDIAVDGAVKLDVYNIKGQLVNTLVNEPKARGKHQVVWNGKDHSGKGVASGIYFVHLSSNSRSSVHKMVLMK
ncbi:MAG: FlgD immunoglobulin-like domain containing protein, partial [Candidatus Cloacimonadaceae bacterium]